MVCARAANKALWAIGSLEVLICLLYGSFLLFASTVGFGCPTTIVNGITSPLHQQSLTPAFESLKGTAVL